MFERWLARFEGSERVDAVAARLDAVVRPVIGDGLVRDALTGRWHGHPTHPVLVIAPLAGWFGGTLLAATGGVHQRSAAQRLIGAGTLAAVPAALAGAADWLTTSDAERRVGTVHACLADGATVAFAASWALFARQRNRAALAAALAGATLAGATGFLGGHLSFRRGVGVATVAFQSGPSEWTPISIERSTSTEHAVRAEFDGVGFAVVASTTLANASMHVLEARCSHRGGPLDQGVVVDGCLECPWHGARFDLSSGRVQRGPASAPQPVYAARTNAGRTEIRRDEPGSLRSNVT